MNRNDFLKKGLFGNRNPCLAGSYGLVAGLFSKNSNPKG